MLTFCPKAKNKKRDKKTKVLCHATVIHFNELSINAKIKNKLLYQTDKEKKSYSLHSKKADQCLK